MAYIAGIGFSPAFIIYSSLIFLLSTAIIFIFNSGRPKAFPPGPRGLPVLGNLFQVDRAFPFRTFSAWAKDYGNDTPVGIKNGTTTFVVLNSSRLVRELFDRRGAVYSDRPPQPLNSKWVFQKGLKAGFIAQNNSPWITRWRRELNNNFGPAAISKLRPVYEAETARFLVKLLEAPTARRVEMQDIIVRWTMSIPCLAVCGRRPDGMSDHGFEIKQFRKVSDEYVAVASPKPRDSFPVLCYLPGSFGMAEWKERARLVRQALLKTGSQLVSAGREQRAALDAGKLVAWESILAKILREQREKDDHIFKLDEIGTPAFHIVSAAVSTSLAVFSTMLMILAKSPKIQQRARNEVLDVSRGAVPKATDIPNLKYIEAFWNEVHRWRPVAPLGVPHAPSQDDFYNGYRIPKGTAVLINVWHINHSEEDFDEPEKFDPDRFLQHPYGMRPDRAHDQVHGEGSSSRANYDFGAGRRICPGMHSAKQSLVLGLVKMLWAFDILPPDDTEIDLSLETGFIQEFALHPKNFDVILKLRVGRTKEDIMEHYSQAYITEAEAMGWEGELYK